MQRELEQSYKCGRIPQSPKTTLTKHLELSRLSNRTICLKEGQSDLANCWVCKYVIIELQSKGIPWSTSAEYSISIEENLFLAQIPTPWKYPLSSQHFKWRQKENYHHLLNVYYVSGTLHI